MPRYLIILSGDADDAKAYSWPRVLPLGTWRSSRGDATILEVDLAENVGDALGSDFLTIVREYLRHNYGDLATPHRWHKIPHVVGVWRVEDVPIDALALHTTLQLEGKAAFQGEAERQDRALLAALLTKYPDAAKGA